MLKHKFWIALGLAIIIYCSTFILVSCKPQTINLDTTPLRVEMFGDYYLGLSSYTGENTQDLSAIFKDSTFAIEDNTSEFATLSGSKLTMLSPGNFNLKVTTHSKPTNRKIFIVDGVNVFDFSQFKNVLESKQKNAIIHSDIKFGEGGGVHIKNNLNIYGNGNVLDVEATVRAEKSWGGDAIVADSESVNIQDIHIVGKDMRGWTDAQKVEYKIENLERFGSLISYRSNDFSATKVGGTIKNIVAENGHSLISLTGSSVNIQGSIFRNAADSLVSVETKENGGTKLNVKNNIFINAVVAAINCWGYNKTANGYLDLTTDGFMDVYNWKDSKTAKIMPGSESMSGMVNGMIATELANKKNDVYMYNQNSKKYIHVAIVILATGGLKKNSATLDGVVLVDAASKTSYALNSPEGYVLRKLPGASLANTACVVGYGNNQDSPNIKVLPSSTLNLDKIYSELRNGR